MARRNHRKDPNWLRRIGALFVVAQRCMLMKNNQSADDVEFSLASSLLLSLNLLGHAVGEVFHAVCMSFKPLGNLPCVQSLLFEGRCFLLPYQLPSCARFS